MGLNALTGALECKSKKIPDDSNYYVVRWFSNNLDSLEGLNGVNRQPSKKVIFNVHCQMQNKINRQKFQVISNLTISPDLNGILAAEESLSWKDQFPCSQRNLYRHYKSY